MGKTKEIAIPADNTERCHLCFKDDVCTDATTGKFDPGANQTGLQMHESGIAAAKLSAYFFPLIEKEGIPTHFICAGGMRVNGVDEARILTVKHVKIIPVEFIWRDKAWGSFCKMYGVEKGLELHGLIEATLKDDALGDPRINAEAAIALGKLTEEQYDLCDGYTRQVGNLLASIIREKGLELIDFKLEFGTDDQGKLMLADEISGNVIRVIDKEGNSVDPIELAKIICG